MCELGGGNFVKPSRAVKKAKVVACGVNGSVGQNGG